MGLITRASWDNGRLLSCGTLPFSNTGALFLRDDGTWSPVAGASTFGPAGAAHATGLVPDPGAAAHGTPYLLGENATWLQVTGSGVGYSGGVLTFTNSGGTVTSVGISGPSIVTWSGSPVVGSGTLTGTLADAAANTVLAGPASGGAGTPAFRAPVLGDLPSITLAALESRARPAGNLLINGGMRLAQRPGMIAGATVAADKYGADRWRGCRENSSLQHSRVDTNGALETGIAARYYSKWTKITNAGKFLICQPLEAEDSFPLLGRTVIYQAKLKGNVSRTLRMAVLELNSSGTVDTIPASIVPATWGGASTDPTLGANLAIVGSAASPAQTTAWANFSVSVTAPTNSKNLLVAVWSDSQLAANDWIAIAEAGLYDGASVRDWLPGGKGAQAADVLAAQRFYEKSGDPDSDPTRNGAYDLEMTCTGTTTANGSQYGQWPWLAVKRVNPVVSLHPYTTGTNSGQVSDNGGTDLGANSGASVGGINRLAIQNSSGGVVTHNGLILFKFEADAEL